MPTLEELLSNDLGAEQPSMNKEASQNAEGVTDEIEKLAMEIGLVENNETNPVAENNPGQSKEAQMGLDSLYADMFPEDAQHTAVASEKTASIVKEAAEVEEAMGKAAYDAFQTKVDQMVTKIADEKVAAGEAVDAEPVQAIENNRQGKDGGKMDTTPAVTNELPAENGPAVVGQEQQKSAALRKHLLLSQLEK